MSDEDEEPSCADPCHPDVGCEQCAGYWSLMVNEGLWDPERKQWTDKGWRMIVERAKRQPQGETL